LKCVVIIESFSKKLIYFIFSERSFKIFPTCGMKYLSEYDENIKIASSTISDLDLSSCKRELSDEL